MILHVFTCSECDGKPFYTSFEPVYDDSYCPCCGQDKTVKYQGTVQMVEVLKRGEGHINPKAS